MLARDQLHRLVRLFRGIKLALRMILKHPSRAAKEKTDDNNGDQRAGRRARKEPCAKLKNNDKGEHEDDRDAATPEDAESENERDDGDNNADTDADCGVQRCMLQVLLIRELPVNQP